jgi:HEAT repeat protein
MAPEPKKPVVSEFMREALERDANKTPEKPDEPTDPRLLPVKEITSDAALAGVLEEVGSGLSGREAARRLRPRIQSIRADLIRGLRHPEPNVRSVVADVLRHLGTHKDTTAAFIEALKNEGDGDVRGNIAKAMVRYRHRETVPVLIATLQNDTNKSARANSAWALREIGDKRAGNALVMALDDGDAWVRLYAVGGVSKLGMKKAIPRLRVLRFDDSSTVREKAERALRKLGAR